MKYCSVTPKLTQEIKNEIGANEIHSNNMEAGKWGFSNLSGDLLKQIEAIDNIGSVGQYELGAVLIAVAKEQTDGGTMANLSF